MTKTKVITEAFSLTEKKRSYGLTICRCFNKDNIFNSIKILSFGLAGIKLKPPAERCPTN